jgi:hypothetical protein
MRIACVVPPLLSLVSTPAAAGEPRFALPLSISGVRTPVTVAAGDINGDGRRDLVAGSGGPEMTVVLQDPADRGAWKASSVRLGSSVYFVRPVDLDGDGFAEVLIGDTSLSLFLVPNDRGTLAPPVRLSHAIGARWVTVGDWDRDGLLDCATANFSANTVSVFSGVTPGLLQFQKSYNIAEPHAIEGSDHDGDGDLDLLLGHGDHGLRTLKNGGDGAFAIQGLVRGFVPCARYVYAADFNGDGLGDTALTCLRLGAGGNVVGNVLAGMSRGDGSFAPALDVPTIDIATLAIGDLNGDGHRDVAQVSVDLVVLTTYMGSGDGSFSAPELHGVTGAVPSFLASADLDGDGRADVAAANAGSSTLTVFWGQQGEQHLTGAAVIAGANGSASAVADLDGDGARDLFFTTPTPPQAVVHFGTAPGKSPRAPLAIPTSVEYDDLTVLDLNADGAPDLLGKEQRSGTMRVSFLNAAGAVLRELSWVVADPGSTLIFDTARLDADAAPDLVVAARRLGGNDATVYLNRGDAFLPGATFLTVDRRGLVRLADVDGDGNADLLAAATGVVGVHFGQGDGTFGEPLVVFQGEPPRAIGDLVVAELSGDAHLDVAVAIPGRQEIALVRGRGERGFEPPLLLGAPSGIRSLSLVDWNDDARRDLAFLSSSTVSVLVHQGAAGLGPALEIVRPPAGAVDLLLEDLEGDGALDLVLFGATRTYLFSGLPPEPLPPPFRRGDVDASGAAELTDAVALLDHLFRGGPAPCADASDADDDGQLGLTDAVVLLQWLFQGGPAPGAPGPFDCGEDPTADGLGPCEASCL